MYIDGDRIRKRRKQLKLSQEELAARVGTTQKQISNYERGTAEPGTDRLYMIAKELEVSTDWLYCLTDFMKPSIGKIELEAIELLLSQTPEQREKIIKAIKALV